jgi:hypothetical protein
MRFAFLTVIPLALAACAGNQPLDSKASAQVPAASASDAQVALQTCHREIPVGSNIPVTRCTPTDNGQSFRQMHDDMQKSGGGASKASGLN